MNASAEEKKKTIEESNSKYAHILNDVTKAVIEDVDAFVKSYNYEDCDGMIDYFDVDFYYFGCCQDNGAGIKIVPKTARIKNKKASVKTSSKKKNSHSRNRSKQRRTASATRLRRAKTRATVQNYGL